MSETLSDTELDVLVNCGEDCASDFIAVKAAAEIRTLRAAVATLTQSNGQLREALTGLYAWALTPGYPELDAEARQTIEAALGVPLTEKGN